MIQVQGNGNIVSREISVSTFIRLHLGCKGTVELHQSDEEKVIFEADENLQEFFCAGNAGRTLYVSTDGNLRQPVFTKATTKIFIRQLDKLYVRNDRGNVVCPNQLVLTQPLEVKVQSVGDTELNLVVPSLKISSQTEGNITLKGSCGKMEISNMMQGDFDASEMKADELFIKNMSEGNVKLYAEKTIRMKHYGEGYVHYYGPATVTDVVQYGTGEIKHMKGEPAGQ